MCRMRSESGSALLVVLFVVTIMLAITSVYVAVTVERSEASDLNVSTERSFYAAESGLDASLASLNNGGDGYVTGALASSPGPGMAGAAALSSKDGIDNNGNGVVDDNTEAGNYTGAYYQAQPTAGFQYFPWGKDGLDNDNDGQIDESDEKDTYLGEIFSAGSASGYVTTICARVFGTRSSAFGMAMFGDEYVTITGADAMTDSYHSGKGTYASQLTTWDDNGLDDDGDGEIDEADEQTHANLEGDVGTNGIVTLNGQPLLFGDVSYFEGLKLGQGAICGDIGKLPTPIILDPIPPADVEWAATHNNNASIMKEVGGSLVPVVPPPVALEVSPSAKYVLPAGTYYFTSMTVKGDIEIAGNVTIYCTGDIDFQSASKVFNTSLKPTDLTILCTGSDIKMCANVDFYGALYAPNAYIDINSNFTDFYGSVVGKGVKMAGNAAFHYDEAVGEKGWSPRFLWTINSWELRHTFSAESRTGGKTFEDYYELQ